ncbi:MAG: universal stress protein [Candidatus Eremiobacteraeota bacterium]|nr:universal stress protein [Candidatus Eremiobacteraeota bacterium]
MNKILLPLDGSDLAESAVEVAANMSDSETVFVLLRVINPLLGAISKAEKEEARDYLNGFVSLLAKKKAPADIRVLVVEGPVAQKIIDVAEEEGAGLIVMTTQGAGGLARWLIGSAAERVVRHAPCPVLTIGRRTLEKGFEVS